MHSIKDGSTKFMRCHKDSRRLVMRGSYQRSNHYLADIWASLYKMKPEMTKEDVAEDLQVNKSLMEKIMTDDSFENYRNFTRSG